MSKKVKIGVLGAFRGQSMITVSKAADNMELVAICDKSPEALAAQRVIAESEGLCLGYYDDFDDFLTHDMDAVVLANYANEHAPFAIKAMKAGKHVYSECLPFQTMKEAVELIETVEETGLVYGYGENYCYMPAMYEMAKLYKKGKIGEFEYGECEYVHYTVPIHHALTYGQENHWRNNMYSTFYCTHSTGPIIHATGLRPVSVIGLEGTQVEEKLSVGAKNGAFGIEMIVLENGGIIKSIHGGLHKGSVWCSMYGSKGAMESARSLAKSGDVNRIYVETDEYCDGQIVPKYENYEPKAELDSAGFSHGGSDFIAFWNFAEKIKGNPKADIIDVYEATDTFLCGMFAYRSILDGGTSKEIPNLRDKEVRELWRNDTACTDPNVAGDMLLPTFSKGTPDIPKEVYDRMKALWNDECQRDDGNYRAQSFKLGKETLNKK